MHGPNDKVRVIPNHGPFAGQEVEYLRHAADAAVNNGFAEWPDQKKEVPEDFPGHSELAASGFRTMESIPRDLRDLMSLPGIGKKGAEKILEALAE